MKTMPATSPKSGRPVVIESGGTRLDGELTIPDGATGIVIFAHGSGSSRHSPRNRFVASVLQEAGLGTLLFDLLTQREEEEQDLRFAIGLLAERVAAAVRCLRQRRGCEGSRLGLFGASTGAAAALVAASGLPDDVSAVVSRGGRPDLAGDALPMVQAPTLLIVGGLDEIVLGLNEQAKRRMHARCRLVVVPGATHLFEEPGTLEQAARLAAEWFVTHLGRGSADG